MDVGRIRATLELNSQNFNRNLDAARTRLEQTGRTAHQTSKGIDKLSNVFLATSGALAVGVGAAVKTGMDFEAQMSRVKSISSATDSEFQALKKSAMDLGASTSKSASEVAIGFERMAAKGMSVNDIIGAMPGVIAAAEASGSDMAQTADVMSSALNIFSLKASEASRVSDILAKTANISSADLTDMQYALKYAGPPAAALGVSLEELAGSIGIMTDSGMAGEQASTTLRSALLSLLNPSEKNSKLMGKMGIAVADAKGNFVGLSPLIKNLSDSMKGQTETQKAATLAALVGTESVSGMLSLMAAGPAKIDKMTEAIKNSAGSSAEAAKIMKDNLKGSIDQLQGSLETIGITLSEDALPLLSDFAKEIANVLSSMDSVDMANLKAGLSFAGVASGIGLAGTSLAKLGIAARGLFLAMGGPVTLTIGALALLGGSIAAAVVKNKEMEKARLDNISAGFKEVRSLDATVKAYDVLKHKSALTNDEFGRYLDLQAELKSTSDPKAISSIKDEMERLREKSGLSNDELNKMVGLNKDIVDKTPEVTKAISAQGQAYVDNTKAVKDFNKAKLDSLYKDLDLERIKNETKYKDLVKEEKDLIKEIKNDNGELKTLTQERDGAQKLATESYNKYNDMLKESSKYSEAELETAHQTYATNQQAADTYQKQLETKAKSLQKSKDELATTQKNKAKLDEINQKMAQIVLQQAGLNSKKGQEMQAVDGVISKLKAQKKALYDNTTPAERNTVEFKNSASAIDAQIGKLGTVKAKIAEITGDAGAMNDALRAEVNKYINVYVQEQTTRNKNMPAAQLNKQRYHTGGIIGQMPKLHTGGLAAQFANAPSHNEIDVRLLRNEMVLTEAQQSNLMRMIDAGVTGGSINPDGITKADLDRFTRALEASSNRPVDLSIDGYTFAKATYKEIDRFQARDLRSQMRARGE